MTTKTIPFDPARYLSSPESQAELLTDALETGHAGYIANALGVIARARGMTEVARGAGVTREALYKTLSGSGDPKLTTLLGVIKSLGFTLSAQTVRRKAKGTRRSGAAPTNQRRTSPPLGRGA
jgi:probable addiction module antidote protein